DAVARCHCRGARRHGSARGFRRFARGPRGPPVGRHHRHALRGCGSHWGAGGGRRWLFSASPDALVARPGVSRAIDAVALSEWLCGWYPAVEDTAFRDVKRVPPATVTAIRGNRV